MSESVVDPGGTVCLDIGSDLLDGGAIGPDIRVRDMGPDCAYAESVGRIPP